MASGSPVLEVLAVTPPAANYATPDARAGGSTPAEYLPCWDFDADAVEYLDFLCRLSEDYDGGGLTLGIYWAATSATSGAVVWQAAVRRIADDAEDIDAAHTYDYNSVTATAASASGEVDYTTITFTHGADMDSWAAGELAIVRVSRLATDGSDTMTGDAELVAISGKET